MSDAIGDRSTKSSGNVFADLGMADPETHRLKAELVSRIRETCRARGLSQTEAANIIGLSQPDISRMFRGRFRDITVDRLIRALTGLELAMEIKVSDHGRAVGETIHLGARESELA